MRESKLTRCLAHVLWVTVAAGPFAPGMAWAQTPPAAPEVPVFGA